MLMNTIRFVFVLFCAALFVSCDEGETIELSGNYFPLQENALWEYTRKVSSLDKVTPGWTDTVSNRIKGDTLIESLLYKKVVDKYDNLVKVVRKEGSKYFGRNHELYGGFSKEYLFLDDNVDFNSGWKHFKNDSTTVTEYKVIAVNSTETLNGVYYHDLMKMEVSYYYLSGKEFVLSYSTLHYYAKGIGEVYTSYPYPSYVYGDMDIFLLKYIP